MKITFADYDLLQEELEMIPNQYPTWMPSEDDIKEYVVREPEKYLEFLIWLTATILSQTSEEFLASLRTVNHILYDNVIMVD